MEIMSCPSHLQNNIRLWTFRPVLSWCIFDISTEVTSCKKFHFFCVMICKRIENFCTYFGHSYTILLLGNISTQDFFVNRGTLWQLLDFLTKSFFKFVLSILNPMNLFFFLRQKENLGSRKSPSFQVNRFLLLTFKILEG